MKKRRTSAKQEANFRPRPLWSTKAAFGGEKSGVLRARKDEVEKHLMQRSLRDYPLGECLKVLQIEQPAASLDNKELTWKEVVEVVKKARFRSDLGPS